MQAIAVLLAVVGVALALLGFGIKAKLGSVELDWSGKPSRWLALSLAICCLSGGLWLAFEAGRGSIAPVETAEKEAQPPLGEPPVLDNVSEPNSTLAAAPPSATSRGDPDPRRVSRGIAPVSPGPSPAVQGPASHSANATNGSVALVGDVNGSTISASAEGNFVGEDR